MRRFVALLAAFLLAGPSQATPILSSIYSSYTLNEVVLDSASSSPWTVPSGWQSTANGPNGYANKIECIGNGGAQSGSSTAAGGGAYSADVNIALTPGSFSKFNIQNSVTGANDGPDVWFCSGTLNCTSIAGSAVVVGAQGGQKNGTGGSSAVGVGSTKYSGGTSVAAGGGGGAAGPNGAGAAPSGSTGGQGGNGSGGAGGTSGNPGDAGTEIDGSVGSGGGGGTSASGGIYGGGTGSNGSHTGGRGVCVIWYYTL